MTLKSGMGCREVGAMPGESGVAGAREEGSARRGGATLQNASCA